MGYHHFFRSAYGQLILIVFLPISVLASVGAMLVFFETTRAVRSEQDALAQAALIRYAPLIRPLLPSLHPNDYAKLQSKIADMGAEGMTTALVPDTHGEHIGQRYMVDKLYRLQEQQVKRLAIMDNTGAVIVAIGYDRDADWGVFDASADSVWRLPTAMGTAYGMPIYSTVGGARYKHWLFVEMDDEPLIIAYYRIVLALAVTGLITLLLLLLILNSYSKRWISPIYEMRLFLQRLSPTTLGRRFVFKTHGEFYLLQKELNVALKRLHNSVKDLQAHNAQTEKDLQSAFDEMEMQNISIRKARDIAVSGSHAKSAFLTNISHELRTPLNAIDGFINLLAQDGKLSGKQALYVQTIQKSSAHLLALISDVLDFSKMEAGKLSLDWQEFNFYDVVYEVADMLSPMAYDKGLRLSVLYYSDVPQTLMGDRLRVKQILTNLVGNAIKFTATGSVDIVLLFDEHSPAISDDIEAMVRVEVSDTGRGVDDKTAQTLFTSFGQGDISITKRYGGTGLGLVICKQLVALMHGRIGFFNNEDIDNKNMGATFWFSLPCVDEPVIAEPKLPTVRLLAWLGHPPTAKALRASVALSAVTLSESPNLLHLLQCLADGQSYDWVLVDSFEQKGDIAPLLQQIRQYYTGRLLVFGYEVGLSPELLQQYDAKPLYEPFSTKQFYAHLWQELSSKQSLSYDKVSVLAVDDHLPNLLVLEALLGEFAIKVTKVESGLTAVELITKGVMFDLIFMDISMPVMSGLQTATAIRNIEATKKLIRTPIVALSAHGYYEDMAGLYKAGIDDYATKPIAKNELQLLLQKWLASTPKSTDAQTRTKKLMAIMQSDKEHDDKLLVIDWQDALKRSAGKADLAGHLLQFLQASVNDEMQALTQAWSSNDRQALTDISHRLVGGCRYTGVPLLRKSSEQLYVACQNTTLTWQTLEGYYLAVMTALEQIKQADLAYFISQNNSNQDAND